MYPIDDKPWELDKQMNKYIEQFTKWFIFFVHQYSQKNEYHFLSKVDLSQCDDVWNLKLMNHNYLNLSSNRNYQIQGLDFEKKIQIIIWNNYFKISHNE